jgi:hypothetical protein
MKLTSTGIETWKHDNGEGTVKMNENENVLKHI